MNRDYGGNAVEDIEVGRYGLRTFEYQPNPTSGGPLVYHANHLMYFELAPPSNTKLRPIFTQHAPDSWQDGTCTAECITAKRSTLSGIRWTTEGVATFSTDAFTLVPPSEHEIPNEHCECGVYAALTLDHLMSQYPHNARSVVAVIAAEGRTLIGNRGFRTQYARVVAYWCHKNLRSACEEQFKDAERFRRMCRMLREYNFPEPAPYYDW